MMLLKTMMKWSLSLNCKYLPHPQQSSIKSGSCVQCLAYGIQLQVKLTGVSLRIVEDLENGG